MKSFRLRLILALIFGITLVSVASTYIEVLEHTHALRQELIRRVAWQSKNLQSEMEKALAGDQPTEIAAAAARLCAQYQALGLGVYDLQGGLETEAGHGAIFNVLPLGPLNKAIQKDADSFVFGHLGDQDWLEEAIPLHVDGRTAGALVILEDARSIQLGGRAYLAAKPLADFRSCAADRGRDAADGSMAFDAAHGQGCNSAAELRLAANFQETSGVVFMRGKLVIPNST